MNHYSLASIRDGNYWQETETKMGNKTDYDPKKFIVDTHGNLIPRKPTMRKTDSAKRKTNKVQ